MFLFPVFLPIPKNKKNYKCNSDKEGTFFVHPLISRTNHGDVCKYM